MVEYSYLLKLNPYAASNVLTPAIIAIFAVKIVGVALLLPAVKLYWAKVLWTCFQQPDETSK